MKNGYIKFSKKHKTLLKQMTEYPMGKNDDAPDGLQMAVKLALDVKIGRRVDYRSVIARALDFRRGAYYPIPAPLPRCRICPCRRRCPWSSSPPWA